MLISVTKVSKEGEELGKEFSSYCSCGHKHEDLSSNPNIYKKKLGVVVHIFNTRVGAFGPLKTCTVYLTSSRKHLKK